MWSNALFLLRVRVQGVRFLALLAVWPLTGLMLGLAPLCSLIPGEHGKKARKWLDTALTAVWTLSACGKDSLVDVDMETKGGQRVRILLQGMGVGFPVGEGPSAPSKSPAAGALLVRAVGCVLAFLLCGWAFGGCSLEGALLGGAVLTLVYILVRPLLQALLLPLNLLLLGVLTPLTDALLVWWACAWTPGTDMGYWQAVCAALLCALLWLPYGAVKQRQKWLF